MLGRVKRLKTPNPRFDYYGVSDLQFPIACCISACQPINRSPSPYCIRHRLKHQAIAVHFHILTIQYLTSRC
jgi:hypothetical protein